MKYERKKSQRLILILVVGFFVGIIFENWWANRYGVSIRVFRREQIELLKETYIQRDLYFFYVFKLRMIPFMLMLLLWSFRWRKILLLSTIAWIGFLLGRTVVAALLTLGGIGILISLFALFPHMIFYVFSYAIIFSHLMSERKSYWNKSKTVMVLATFLLGLLLEIYVNPGLMKLVCKWI